MDMPGTEKRIDLTFLQRSVTYEAYKQLIDDLLAAGKATGPVQSEAMTHYSQLNVQRMHRVEKTIQILPEVREQLLRVNRPQTWLVMTEGWCGDAAQSLPVMKALADLNANIQMRILLRDENPGLMDRYLTNGVSRSIPRLISVDPATGVELFNWGPRPTALQETFYGMRSEGLSYDVIKEELQRWYNTDKTITIQRELAAETARIQAV
ncbi:MAG TPA: thioredoxin family protein [Puia sp.]|jgi:hypothetical protein|nr:thioredoxin family protein [Puia sp.]